MEKLSRYTVLVRPQVDWRTTPLSFSTVGNPVMAKLAESGEAVEEGFGRNVIDSMEGMYRSHGVATIMIDSSEAARKVTMDILGSPNPDDVFSVDYVTSHRLTHQPIAEGVSESLSYVNVVNNMSTPSRWLEPYVMRRALSEMGVQNVISQPEGSKFEGGDFTFMPKAFTSESLLVMGEGSNSRSNPAGRRWLTDLLMPDHILEVHSEGFHRDLVSCILLDVRGCVQHLVLVGDSSIKIDKQGEDILKIIPISRISDEVTRSCALNLSVFPGKAFGMQSHPVVDELMARLNIVFNRLPDQLEQQVACFSDLQGGANCVSGNILVNPMEADLSPGNISRVNGILHGNDFKDELYAIAENLDIAEAVKSS